MTWIVFSSALHAHHQKDMILQSNKVVGPLLKSTALNVSSHDLPLVTTEHEKKQKKIKITTILLQRKSLHMQTSPVVNRQQKQYTHSANK